MFSSLAILMNIVGIPAKRVGILTFENYVCVCVLVLGCRLVLTLYGPNSFFVVFRDIT